VGATVGIDPSIVLLKPVIDKTEGERERERQTEREREREKARK